MLTLEEIKKRLQDRNLSEISRKTGISYMTIWKVSKGSGASYATVLTLSEYLEKHQ
jgi:predicted transcriptional regulator